MLHFVILEKKLSSFYGGWKGTELEDIVNSATDTPYLQRLTLTEVMSFKQREKAKFTIRKNNVRFIKPTPQSYIEFLSTDVDLSVLGMKDGDNVIIKGARIPQNNSGNFLYKVKTFSKNKIVFDKAVKLESEAPGAMVSIEVFDKSYSGSFESLNEYNKNNLTTCVPDDRMFSSNYNYREGFYEGCQFVAMNYQSMDQHMKDYFEYFMEYSFRFKPTSLVHNVELPKMEGIGKL